MILGALPGPVAKPGASKWWKIAALVAGGGVVVGLGFSAFVRGSARNPRRRRRNAHPATLYRGSGGSFDVRSGSHGVRFYTLPSAKDWARRASSGKFFSGISTASIFSGDKLIEKYRDGRRVAR